MSLDRRLLQGIDDRRVSFSENLLISRFKSMEKSYKSSPKVKGKSERNWSGSKKSGRSAAIDVSVDSRDVAVSSETPNVSTEDVNRRREDVVSDGSSSSDEKPSLRDDAASLSSHDTSFEKKRKKKWTIKLPWKKKNKTRYEDPPSVSETSSSHTEDEASSDAVSVSSAQEDVVIKNKSSKEESPQMGKRKGASSWYGFKTNQSSENVGKSTDSVDDGAHRRDDGANRLDGRSNDSVDDGAHHCDVRNDGPKKTKRPTYNFHYSSSSESEPEIFPPSKPYHKRVKEKNKKLPRNVDVTQSSLDLMPSGSQLNKSTQEEEKEFSDPGSQASSVRDETEASQEVARSSKQTEPRIKKSYSLPSIFFRRNKKKKEMEQRKYESRKYDSHKEGSDGENFSDSDSQKQQSGPSKSDSMKIRMKNRSSYVETPLVFVGKEKLPTLKSWAPTENIFQREYANNVETVDSIFKRSSYKRVYKNRETSSITYPSKVQGEKKIAKGFDSDSTDSQHSPKNTRQRSSTVTVESPSTSSVIQETSSTNTKKQVSASQTPTTRSDQLALLLKEPIKSSVRRSGKEHKIDAEKKKVKEYVDPKKSHVENLHKKDKPKILETKAEVNYNRKELELKEKQDMTRNFDVSISKATEADNAFSNRKKPQPDEKENTVKQSKSKATIVSKREDIFEKSLNRDLQEAKKTVQDVNDQFGQSIFTRNYRASTVSSSPTSVIKEQNSQNDKKSLTATLPTMSNNSKSSRGMKSKRRDRDHDPLIRRRSYEEMINQLEDEMFESDDSSDTDIDQIDLSFKKPHMEAKVDFEIIKNISDKEKRSSKLLSSDDDSGGEEHIYHIRVVPSGKLAPTEKKLPEIVRPLSYPPPPPSVIYSMTSKEEKHLHLVQDKSSCYTKEDSSSQGYLSSNEEDGEIIYANTTVKKKKKTKLKDRENNEINQLLDESIKKYVRTDSPPNFSPPVIIPEPKFSPGLNDRSVYSINARQLPETKIDSLKDQEHTTAIQTANKLLLQRKQQRISHFKDEFNSKNLPIKNIKSLRSNNAFLPPPPPSLPPPEEDPFWLPSKTVNQTISQNSPTKSHSLSISHGPTISYSPSQETVDAAGKESLNKYSKTDSLPSSTAAGSQNKLIAGQGLSSSLPSFDVEFHDPPVIMSPVLLKAEIVDRGNKPISVLDLKREFVGPYKVSPLESSKNQDTRKQAVSFCLASDEELKESEQIYVNQQPPKMRDSHLYKNSSLPTQSFTQKKSRQHNQNSMQEKNILNNQTRSQEKHITHNQVLRQENKSLSSGTKTMMKENTPNRNEISNQSESTLHLHNPTSGSMKTSVNQYNTYPYSKTEGYSNMLRTAHQSQPDELKSPSMVKQENLSLTRMRGTPLAYEVETAQHSKNILRPNVRPAFSPPMAPVDLNKMYNVKVAPITVVPNQRPPLKSILRKTNVPKTNFPQVLSPQPPISNLVTRYYDSDVERVKLNTTSSESGSPPAIPDYPPPPPRKMTEVQQIFIESLLHPSEEQSSGASLTKMNIDKRDPGLGHTALVHPRSRVPYIDQSRSEFNSPYIMGSQKISQSNEQQRTYQHYVESYPHRPHLSQSHTPMMGTLDLTDRSESNWNKLREQIRNEESIYQNYGLKTDV